MDYVLTLQRHASQSSWVTIGAFDGVHLGHQSLFQNLVEGAHRSGCPAIAVTFDPLPAVLLKNLVSNYALSSLAERLDLIKSQGVDEVITLPFNWNLVNVEVEDFMQQLKTNLGIVKLLAGFNFTTGKDRRGTVPVLKLLGTEIGYDVEVTKPVSITGEAISSSRIRQLIKNGEIRKANLFLGRAYSISGKVVHGEHRGGKLGIPTANLEIPLERLLPANGVYATRVSSKTKQYLAVTNVGVRPTFENPLSSARVEPHLLDSDEDLYGEHLELEFIDFLRPEQKFANASALVNQIKLDIEKAREILTNEE